MTIPTIIISEQKSNIALTSVHTPTVYFIIDLTSEWVIISEYNHLTDYHHYGNHGALPICTIIMGLWVQKCIDSSTLLINVNDFIDAII